MLIATFAVGFAAAENVKVLILSCVEHTARDDISSLATASGTDLVINSSEAQCIGVGFASCSELVIYGRQS